MIIEVSIDQFDDEDVRDEFRNRFGNVLPADQDDENEVDFTDASDQELLDELQTRGHFFREADEFKTKELIEALKDKTLSDGEHDQILEIIGFDPEPDIIPLEDFDPNRFDRLEDNMKMTVIAENMSRFSLDEITSFFTQSFLKQA